LTHKVKYLEGFKFVRFLQIITLIHQQNAHMQLNTSINYHIFSYIFRRLLRHL